jgi:hypothetical protein
MYVLDERTNDELDVVADTHNPNTQNGAVFQAIEYLLHKCEVLSSNSSTVKKKNTFLTLNNTNSRASQAPVGHTYNPSYLGG